MKTIRSFMGAGFLRFWRLPFIQLATELRRLNSARIGNEELLQLSSRDRVRAVKDALAAHHKGSARCC